MPIQAKSPHTGRPAGGKQPKAKVKFWVLWEPPTQILLFIVMAAVFASAGLAALRYSSAQSTVADSAAESGGSLLWHDGPDATVGSFASSSGKQVLTHWRPSAQYVYGGGSVKVASDQTKGKVLQFIGTANNSSADVYGQNQRAEQVADINLKKGKTYWFGFDLFVEPGGGVASGRQSVWQLLPQPDKSPAKLWLAVNSNQRGLALESENSSWRLGPVPETAWSRLVLGMHIEADDSAWIEVWRDGQLTVSRQPVFEGIIAKSANTAVVSVGLYRAPQPWDLIAKMADLKAGTSKEAVQ